MPLPIPANDHWSYDHVHFEIPDARHPTGCAGNDGRAAPTAGAPVTIRSRAQAPDDLLNKGTKSLHLGRGNTYYA